MVHVVTDSFATASKRISDDATTTTTDAIGTAVEEILNNVTAFLDEVAGDLDPDQMDFEQQYAYQVGVDENDDEDIQAAKVEAFEAGWRAAVELFTDEKDIYLG